MDKICNRVGINLVNLQILFERSLNQVPLP
jgi:hypothetical protein